MAEKRLIYLEDVKEALTGWETDPTDEEIEYVLNQLPTVDAVKVVRCEDCKHIYTLSSGMTFCKKIFPLGATRNDDFCSYGEREKEE